MKITIYGEPVPKERPRKGKYGNFYTPRATKQYEELIAYSALGTKKIDGPVSLTVSIFTGNKKLDIDNVLKVVSDALNGHAYEDDRQICEVHAFRIWSGKPRIEICVEESGGYSE
jgi:Holliday junction resolvase RusA-like endonuclease